MIHGDIRRSIVLDVPYQSLSSYCRSSARIRAICQDPTFWRDKALHDFPNVIHSREEFNAIPERTDRLRYLNVYNRINESKITKAQSELTNLHAVDWHYRDYLELREYIHQQRRERFDRGEERLPVVHDWVGYGQTRVQIETDPEGRIYYDYTSADGKPQTLELSHYFNQEDIVDGVEIADILSVEYPRSLDDLVQILSDVNGVDLSPTDIQPDDLILLEPPNQHEVYFVYRQLNGDLGVALSVGYDLPEKVLDMFRRRDIHSQVDLYDLYGSIIQIKDTIDTDRAGNIAIPENEYVYNQRREGVYHESILPALLSDESE